MMVSERDKAIVRELAKRYVACASTEAQKRAKQRACDTNDLKLVRPPVMIDEIPWCQMNVDNELTCLCEDEAVREIESDFRKSLFYFKHFKADKLV